MAYEMLYGYRSRGCITLQASDLDLVVNVNVVQTAALSYLKA